MFMQIAQGPGTPHVLCTASLDCFSLGPKQMGKHGLRATRSSRRDMPAATEFASDWSICFDWNVLDAF